MNEVKSSQPDEVITTITETPRKYRLFHQPLVNFVDSLIGDGTRLNNCQFLRDLFLQLSHLHHQQRLIPHLTIRKIHFCQNYNDFDLLQAWLGQN